MKSSLFEYSDYRSYLRDWISQARKEKRSNLSQVAKQAQVHTTYLSQVLSGLKDLNLEQASLMADLFELSPLEREYFFVLIQLDKAGNSSLKTFFQNKKKEIEEKKNTLEKRFQPHKQLGEAEKSKFYSSWIYAAIWSATDIQGGQTVDQIADRFSIKRPHAEDVLNFLVQAGLCVKDQGIYRPGEIHVHVPSTSHFVFKHHSNWRIKALSSMESRNEEDLFFTSPMAVSDADFRKIRERTNTFIKEVVEIVKSSKSEKIVSLNIDFFRLHKE